MAYANQFQFDLFVSYARVDNQIPVGGVEGWVSVLVKSIKIALAEHLGRSDSASVWMDVVDMAGNREVPPEINRALRDSALMLLILSPGYRESDWCLRELRVFIQATRGTISPSSRVFVVERLPVEVKQRPAEIADVNGYHFWKLDEETRPRALAISEPEYKKEDYHRVLTRLVDDIVAELKRIRTAPTGSFESVDTSRSPEPPTDGASTMAEPLPVALRAPECSLGLFVGIGAFDRRSYLSRLPHAPDDAIALAHTFINDLGLIAPERVWIALGGPAASARARRWLENLEKAGTKVVAATRTELLYAIEAFADEGASVDGLCALAFSTHGFVDDGTAYLMPADGSRRFMRETGLTLDTIFAACNRVRTHSKLFIVDGCRASVEGGSRGAESMTDEFVQILRRPRGLAVVSSCGAGQLSWESPQLGQGVFTHYFVEGIRGAAPAREDDGMIALDDAFNYALSHTNAYVRKNVGAEQLPWYGGEEAVRAMPLSMSRSAKQRIEEVKQRRIRQIDAKETSLRHFVEARLAHKALLSLSMQERVETALELLDGDRLSELIENLQKLADKRRSSCEMFAVWWNTKHAPSQGMVDRNILPPRPHALWSNSLGMTFVPVGQKLMAVWPTRVQDFRSFVLETDRPATDGQFYSLREDQWMVQGHNWMSPGFPQSGTHPAVGVTWEDGVAFCRWLTKREHEGGILSSTQEYRLPSDAEWSEAVGEEQFPWGSEWPPPPIAGNYWLTRGVPAIGEAPGTTAVGCYAANQFGIHDLGGNVWEWCEDWYRSELNPPRLRQVYEFLNDDGGGRSYHYLRGGSWFNRQEHEMLSAFRNPGKFPKARFANVGFRCVLAFELQLAPTTRTMA